MLRDLKYLTAYVVPILAFCAVSLGGVWTYATVLFSFVLIPVLEPVFPNSTKNYSLDERDKRLNNRLFDFLLYLNVPIVYALLLYSTYILHTRSFDTFERIGIILSLGTTLGSCGINVAHELGHRKGKLEQFLAKMLLLPNFYLHFFIEHNQGHHKYVSTPEDPATARKNESIYFFWARSVVMGYLSAWGIEKKRLKRAKAGLISWRNQMLWFTIITMCYILILFYFLTPFSAAIIIASGVVGFLLLETINYVEHYGLMRKRLENGRYEPVRAKHSWNSNHELGRIVLYELTRHSDHHYQPHKKFQILEHHDDALQLPFGYPTSMLMTLIPPLWFYVMNPKLR
ncbi:MAG: alkane 1-monooxygenase [Flavobacteriales bacterium]|nr:alkane 1-monooxygenase [Flavobacteriales bacterium]